MSEILLSIVAGGLAGIAASYVLLRFNLLAAAPPRPAPVAADSAAAASGSVDASASVASLLSPIASTLNVLAEEVSHPAQLVDMPEFQAAIAVFRRADLSTPLLGQYALGANWPLACAAFVALADRRDRQMLSDPVLRHLPLARPYVLLYAFRFLTSLDDRPPVGAVLAQATPWWPSNPVIPDFLHDYFTASADRGDRPVFGDSLERQTELDSGAVIDLLQKVQHPFAAELLAELRNWSETRVDREFLQTVGTLWDPAVQDPLLVPPASWQARLSTAAQSFRLPRPRSLLVCGDPRVGKTSFIRLLADEIQKEGWTVFAASGTELMADQSYFGQLEGRIRKIVDALHVRRKVVWFVRDLGQIATAGTHQGQSASILDQILPAIVAGNLIVIGEANQAAAVRLFQLRPSLRSLIEIVPLNPMSGDATAALAHQVAGRIATQRGLAVPKLAVDTAMDLAEQYLGVGQLPGAVLELLKRAADGSLAADETALTAESVVATLSQMSGLPPVILDNRQRVDLGAVREFFARGVIGQDEAVGAIVDRIAMLKAGLTDAGRPIGVFLFAGPTGTGKTELAKTTARYLFGSADRLVRLDMSEFQTVESTAKILGSADGGADSLIDRVRKQPFSVVLLDEFEKAHPNCWDLFLQIFDDGRLSDINGSEADFRHCIIVLTSNLGATLHRGGGLGFVPDPGTFTPDQVLKTIGQTFRPEFVNRLDKIIVFRPLSRELMRDILRKELLSVQERRGLRERAWAVEWESSAIEFLLDRGFSPEMGARPLKRAIDQLLLAPLAATMVEHRFPEGDQFLFVRSNGKEIEVEFVDPDAGPAEPGPPEDGEEANFSLPATILRPTGTAEERASLAMHWRQIEAELSGDDWRRRGDELRLALADPALWQREDRLRMFSRIELADRIAEAARTAAGLSRRYEGTRGQTQRAARELAGRLALQLWNLDQGMRDLKADAPVDAILAIAPVLEAGADGEAAAKWNARLANMYSQWAKKRRLKVEELASADHLGSPILLVTGFGAFRTLSAESGLHVLEEEQDADGARRIVVRVAVAGGPEQNRSAGDAYAASSRLLASVPTSTSIIRRYRERPSPIVRDLASGWRSGRLAAVLAGDFDLIGAIKLQSD